MIDIQWTEEQLFEWQTQRCIVVRQALSPLSLSRLSGWVDEVESWPETPGKWMKYFEANCDKRQLCRVENFIPFHDGFSELLLGPKTIDAVTALMGEAAVLFKEKINFKLPGGAGFSAHQDAPAFQMFGHQYHITMMLAVDPATVENGCLEMSRPVPKGHILPQTDNGTIQPHVEKEMPWSPLEVDAGDLVFFDSFMPHRSPKNMSLRPRRALYVTYNRLVEGDVRDVYFATKRQNFPPEIERDPNEVFECHENIFNLGNPIR